MAAIASLSDNNRVTAARLSPSTAPADADTSGSTDRSDNDGNGEKQGFQWWHWAIGGAIVVAAALAIWLLPVTDWLRVSIAWIDGLGWIGPVAFVGIYILVVCLGGPSTPLNIGAGLAFGVLWGALWAIVATSLGAIVSFLLARHLLGDWVQKKMECYPTCDAVLDQCEKEPWKLLLMVRLHPMLPTALTNYCIGTTTVKLWVFTACTFLASIPTRLVYAYLGSAGHMTLTHGGEEEGISATDWWMYGTGFALALVLSVGLTWFVRRKLKKVEEEA